MATDSKIEWTDKTWNPVRGCSKVSEGCRNCYAMSVASRFSGPGLPYEGLAVRTATGPQWTNRVITVHDRLAEPLTWRKPARVFVNSMSDLFHKDVPDEFIDRVFAVMALCPQHTFQVLTKRPERMREYMTGLTADLDGRTERLSNAKIEILDVAFPHEMGKGRQWESRASTSHRPRKTWPLPNVWIGVSVEDQAAAGERVPHLLQTPAAVRFLSCEPLLGPVELFRYDQEECAWRGPGIVRSGGRTASTPDFPSEGYDDSYPGVDWVIVGGESGPGARPMRLEWAASLVTQCRQAEVSVFVKQLGCTVLTREYPPDLGFFGSITSTGDDWIWHLSGKGGDMREWPAGLRVREYPEAGHE